MSYLHFKTAFDHGAVADGVSGSWASGEVRPHAQSADRAIDAALRSVPLPEGLMTRLGTLLYTVSDETADRADWLRC